MKNIVGSSSGTKTTTAADKAEPLAPAGLWKEAEAVPEEAAAAQQVPAEPKPGSKRSAPSSSGPKVKVSKKEV